MANNVIIPYSGVTVVGTAQDNTQTDNFYLLGGSSNRIVGIGGNINVTGLSPPGTDTGNSVYLYSYLGSISGVMDDITLNGSGNSLTNIMPKGMITPITGSTINDTVLGNGGFNTVNLTDASSSTISVNIGVDPSATAPAGHNGVTIINMGGTNSVSLGGPDNTVYSVGSANTVSIGGPGGNVTLNGCATNDVTFASGAATLTIGHTDDNWFGFTSTVTFAGMGNLLNGGDENFTVSGSTGSSTVHVGDGENSITLGGAGNTVSVWGGDNFINAGGGGSHVTILGVDGTDTATPMPDADDAPVPLSPTDWVTISGAGDTVSATYENVNIWGTMISGATVTLGNGNNSVILSGSPGGGNHVTVGNGGNAISVTGNANTIIVGDGANGVTLSGNTNTVTVNDPTGVGNDIVQLGAGTGDTVSLGDAAGSVTGTGLGVTTVTQAGPNTVTVNLNNGTGHITLGDGNDTVTANGNASMVTAGNGADTVTANGGGDTISLGNGSNTVTANGTGDTITLGNGANTVTANGNGDTFTFGNGNNNVTANGNGDTGMFSTPFFGGNNTLVATGSGDVWTFKENAASTVTATLGSNDSLTQGRGSLDATLLGSGDSVTLSMVNSIGTTITANGNNDNFEFMNNSGGALVLNPSSTGDNLKFDGASMDFTGTATVSGLNAEPSPFADNVFMNGLYTTGGAHITSFTQMYDDMSLTPTGDVLSLLGGGEIKFAANTVFNSSSFHYT
jgi:hypothetical protein